MKYIKAGSTSIYKLLSPKNEKDFIISPSSDYNFTLPDCWTLSWVTTEEKQRSEIKEKLRWNDEKLAQIQKYSDDLFRKNILTWPNLFIDADQVNNYLQFINVELTDCIICSISFPESEIKDLIKVLKPDNNKIGEPGIYKNILQMKEEKRDKENIYGFDIVGIEIGGIIYSSNQLGLKKWLIEKFDIKYNNFGLIESIDQCYNVIDKVNANKNLEDEVPWFICRIDKEIRPTTAST